MKTTDRYNDAVDKLVDKPVNYKDSLWEACIARVMKSPEIYSDEYYKKIFEDGGFRDTVGYEDSGIKRRIDIVSSLFVLMNDIARDTLYTVYADLAANPDKIKSRIELFNQVKKDNFIFGAGDSRGDVWQGYARLDSKNKKWSCLLINMKTKKRKKTYVPVLEDENPHMYVGKFCVDFFKVPQ